MAGGFSRKTAAKFSAHENLRWFDLKGVVVWSSYQGAAAD
jgi:hypothetical protein